MRVDVCLTPATLPAFDLSDFQVAVVVDVFRATSCMVTALDQGVEHIRVFSELEECRKMRDSGYVLAGERGGEQVPDFDLGNSPLAYQHGAFRGCKVAMTTTNGTKALLAVSAVSQVYIGALLNLEALTTKIASYDSALILCAGWKDRPNIEDTLVAGGIVDRFESDYTGDEALKAQAIYRHHLRDPDWIKKASHFDRLSRLNVQEDLDYCLQQSTVSVVPYFDSQSKQVQL